MNIFRKVDFILAKLGNPKAMQRTHVDTYTENRIAQVKGKQIVGNSNRGIWVTFQDLAGYTFMNVSIISGNEIKTTKGSKLSFFKNEKCILEISSDTLEIESDYSNVSNRWITTISYIVSKKEIGIIKQKDYSQIKIETKKKVFSFKKV